MLGKGKGSTSNVNFILENGIKILKGLPLIEISRLKKHPNNIKKHSEEQIKNLMELMKMVGFKDPVVIDKKENIKAGHGRLEAAELLGMKKVPYIPLEGLTKKQMDLFMYMDNHVNESPWIEDNVQLLLEDVPLPDLDTFSVDWDNIISIDSKDETEEIPEPPAIPKSKLGDIYQLGNHRVMCGDGIVDHEKLLDTKPHFSFTDPPYNIGYEYNEYQDKKTATEYLNFCKQFFEILQTHCERVIMTIGHQNLGLWLDIEKPTHIGIWVKRNATSGCKISMFNIWEPIVFYGDFKKFRKRNSDVFEINNTVQKDVGIHTSPKQVKLLADLITNYSNPGEVCLDLFLGSGSTLIACEQTNRTCYGMELDPAYVDVIIQRWENFTGKKAILL